MKNQQKQIQLRDVQDVIEIIGGQQFYHQTLLHARILYICGVIFEMKWE